MYNEGYKQLYKQEENTIWWKLYNYALLIMERMLALVVRMSQNVQHSLIEHSTNYTN